MQENTLQNPDKVLEVKRAISKDQLAVVHSHVRQTPDDLGAAVVHIFRFENGCIVEIWDLEKPLPGKSPNQFGKMSKNVRFRNLKDINEDALRYYIQPALEFHS